MFDFSLMASNCFYFLFVIMVVKKTPVCSKKLFMGSFANVLLIILEDKLSPADQKVSPNQYS